MSITVTDAFALTVVETLGQNTGSASSTKRIVTHDAFNETDSLTASTTPPVTEFAGFVGTLSSGALTIDLTALTSTNGRTLDATGLRLISVLFTNLGNNAMSIAQGASNGYTSSYPTAGLTIHAGASHRQGFRTTPAVASGVKTLDIAGTGSDTFNCALVFGTV